ncbi:tetratricopeptide repeat protein [Erythrobacter sp. LQ02-29]|uniref:tetratricopeptide repeat protein n=1 Tax=Erythrobacter sp. LQ02-29 TaxID=2920384 RepID=UPI001F4EAAE3|nr:tetratricopeptide repeat protein [Erythrobacter sp. LQ02-29]MCP9222935.1 tetratricopeptide repeat protein [Erythrobacter sp. LQ02-29]
MGIISRALAPALLIATAVIPAAAAAQDETFSPDWDAMSGALSERRFADLLRLADEAIAHSPPLEDSEGRRVLCAHSEVEAVLYTALPDPDGQGTIVRNAAPCNLLFYRAYALEELGRRAQAMELMASLTRYAPFRPQYHIEYGYLLAQSGRPEEALAQYRQAIDALELQSDDIDKQHWSAVAQRGIGYALIDLKRWDEAEAAYRKSLDHDPDNAVAQHELEFIARERPRD